MLYIILICLTNQSAISKIPLTLGRLLGQNVALVGVLTLDLACTG